MFTPGNNTSVLFYSDNILRYYVFRLDNEKAKNKQLEDRNKTLQEKVAFNNELSQEQMKDNASTYPFFAKI